MDVFVVSGGRVALYLYSEAKNIYFTCLRFPSLCCGRSVDAAFLGYGGVDIKGVRNIQPRHDCFLVLRLSASPLISGHVQQGYG